MLLHLARTASAAHADVLDGSAKPGLLMPLEMRERDKDVRIHDGVPDKRRLAVLSVMHRHLNVVGPAEPVPNQNLASSRRRIEAVQVCAVQMLQRMLAAARIKRVAVRQEWKSALLLHDIRHSLRIIGPQIGEVSKLAKMHLDCHKLAVHIDRSDPGHPDELLQLLCQRNIQLRPEIREIYLRFFLRFHNPSSLFSGICSMCPESCTESSARCMHPAIRRCRPQQLRTVSHSCMNPASGVSCELHPS